MRTIVTILLCALCYLSAAAQYSIYSVSGEVKIKHGTATWIKAKKGAEVQLRDSICISNNAHVQVLSKQTSQIFESIGSGVFTTHKLISDARKQSARVIAELNKEMYQNAHADNKRLTGFVGASTRGDEELFTDSLYAFLQSDWVNVEPFPSRLFVKPIRKKNAFYLTVKNQSDKGLYINLLIRNKKTDERTCVYVTDSYDLPCIYIAPDSSLSLDRFRFISNKDFDYILWATEHPFDSNHLYNLFSTSAPSKNADGVGVKIFFLKITP